MELKMILNTVSKEYCAAFYSNTFLPPNIGGRKSGNYFFFILLTDDIPVILLQLEKVLEMHYLKIRNFPLGVHQDASHRDTKEKLKKLDLLEENGSRQKCLDERLTVFVLKL